MKKKILFIALLLLAFGVQAQDTVKGFAFEDINQNGKKDPREKGISRVAISNGQEVVLTNEEGQYELPVGEDNIIFVIKPSGYMLATNADNQPRFFYNHKPGGSPEFEYKGVAPTGKLPKSVDFALRPSIENEQFTALIFGDPQPYSQEQVDYFAKGVVSEVEGIPNVEFGLSLGDLVGDNLELFTPYINAVKRVDIPWYNLMGNHDMNYDAKTDVHSDETYEAHFGPANYAFNYGKVHFIVLDDILYPDPRDAKGYWGGFRQDQLTFIENDLKHVSKEHLIVLAFHIPISEPHGDTFRDEDRDRLFDLLKDFPYTLSLSAHTHIQRQDFFTKEDQWHQEKPHHHYNVGTTSGDWYSGQMDQAGVPFATMRDGTPKGYAFIRFDGNQYLVNYKAAGFPENYQMEVFAPKVVAQNVRSSASIYVNFFMGRAQDKVAYRVDEGEWKEMKFVEEYDPAYLSKVLAYDQSEELLAGRRPSNPVDCKHLWRSRIPTNLETGVHAIEIKATDMFGQSFTQTKTYRIEAPKSLQ